MENAVQIEVNEESPIPKYKQIIHSVVHNISEGIFQKGERIPSINQLSEACILSRDTVEKAYNQLKKERIIRSVKGKGYYVTRTDFERQRHILFLVNDLSSYNVELYNSFQQKVGKHIELDLHIYNGAVDKFEKILNENRDFYTDYILILKFRSQEQQYNLVYERARKAMQLLDRERLILLNHKPKDLAFTYDGVFKDFKTDVFNLLEPLVQKFSKYEELVLVDKSAQFHIPSDFTIAFRRFCKRHNLPFRLASSLDNVEILHEGKVYICIEDKDLVSLYHWAKGKGLNLGTDLGVVSIDDSELKALLDISVLTSSANCLAQKAYEMIFNQIRTHIQCPYNYIERTSF